MLHPQERTALILLAGILILLAAMTFLIESSGKETFAAPFSETSGDNTLVLITGTVTAAVNTQTGGHLILTVNNTSVFVPDGALDDPETFVGNTISATGTVQTYRGKKEILVEHPDDISIQVQ